MSSTTTVKIRFTPHEKGIRKRYSGEDPFMKGGSGQNSIINLGPGEEAEISGEKAKQLVNDFPLNFKIIEGESGEKKTKEFADVEIPDKMHKGGKRK